MEKSLSRDKEKTPNFYKEHQTPKGYYDTPDPYAEMSMSVDLRGIHEFAQRVGKEMVDLSYEEMRYFIKKI